MKKKFLEKLFVIGITLILSTTAFAGCGTTVTNASNAVSVSESEDSSIAVKVQSVENNTITAAVGEISSQSVGTPPEKPSEEGTDTSSTEEADDDSNSQSTPPEKPSDENAPDGQDATGGGSMTFVESDETITFSVDDNTIITVEFLQGSQEGDISSITVNAVLEVELDDNNVATAVTVKNLQSGNGFGGSGEVTNGTSANTIDTDTQISGETYTSSGDDENALRVDGSTVTLDDITVEKTGGESSNTEDGDFYGQNAGLLALNGSTVTIKNAMVNTSAVNGNGVFSYGEGTTVNISDSTIRTTERNSGGIHATGGGTTNATNLDVETQGASSAAIRSDRGGGNVNVSGGQYVTNGTGSPAIYSTANISAEDAVLTANNSEGIVIEGKNSVALNNCTVTGNMSGTYNDFSENIHCVMIYQSMSGDAEIGHSTFSAEGGSITSKNGDLFYVTNTTCDISLSDVALTLANENLLTVAGNSSSRGWGTSGANGGDVTFTADGQVLKGNINVDSISSLDMTMNNGTNFTGTINNGGEAGTVSVKMDSSSTWTLTGDSYISSFEGDISNVVSNGYQLYVDGVQQF
ncbi:MAG: hypothetical protein AB7E42_11005 [Anaerotignaceae bacterium]